MKSTNHVLVVILRWGWWWGDGGVGGGGVLRLMKLDYYSLSRKQIFPGDMFWQA